MTLPFPLSLPSSLAKLSRRAKPKTIPLVDRPVLVSVCFFFFYLLTWAGHMDNGDSAFRIAWAKAMLWNHSARIDGFNLGASYCKYSIGHSLLAMPFLALAEAVKRLVHIKAEGPIYMLLFVLNAAIFMGLLAKYLRLRFDRTESKRALLIIGLCTIWLPCSRMDSIEQLVLTFLFGGFLATRLGRPVLGMAIASAALTIRPDAIIGIAALAIWRLWTDRRFSLAIQLGLACLPALAINAGANWVRWGTLREAGYAGEPFSEPFLVGLYGILFSAGRSIFIYSPPLLLGVWAFIRYIRTGEGSRDYYFFASVLIAQTLLYSRWWDWSGDDTWALRFLTPGVMLMCIPAAEYLGGRRWPFWGAALAVTGLAIQILSTVPDPLAADILFRNHPMQRVALYPGQNAAGPNRIDVEDLRFNPRYSPLATNWLMLRLLVGLPPKTEPNSAETERTGTPLYHSLLASGWDPHSVECDLFWLRLWRERIRGKRDDSHSYR